MNLKEFFKDEVKRMADLFDTKQDQYGKVDELNNFKLGALLLGGKVDLNMQFESAKAYMAKHIAFLYSKHSDNITDPKIYESLGDIIVYCHIMRYMMDKNNVESTNSTINKIMEKKINLTKKDSSNINIKKLLDPNNTKTQYKKLIAKL